MGGTGNVKNFTSLFTLPLVLSIRAMVGHIHNWCCGFLQRCSVPCFVLFRRLPVSMADHAARYLKSLLLVRHGFHCATESKLVPRNYQSPNPDPNRQQLFGCNWKILKMFGQIQILPIDGIIKVECRKLTGTSFLVHIDLNSMFKFN